MTTFYYCLLPIPVCLKLAKLYKTKTNSIMIQLYGEPLQAHYCGSHQKVNVVI